MSSVAFSDTALEGAPYTPVALRPVERALVPLPRSLPERIPAFLTLMAGFAAASLLVTLAAPVAAMTAVIMGLLATVAAVHWRQRRLRARWPDFFAALQRQAVPALRAALVHASPANAEVLAEQLIETLATSADRLPLVPAPRTGAEADFLEQTSGDNLDRLVARLAVEVCRQPRQHISVLKCPFYRALLRRSTTLPPRMDG